MRTSNKRLPVVISALLGIVLSDSGHKIQLSIINGDDISDMIGAHQLANFMYDLPRYTGVKALKREKNLSSRQSVRSG